MDPSTELVDTNLDDQRWDAWDARARGATHRQLAKRYGITLPALGEWLAWCSAQIPAEEPAILVHQQLAKLDLIERVACDIIAKQPHATFRGEPILDGNGQQVLDHRMILDACRTLLAAQERRAKLLGLDAPTKLLVADQRVRHIVEGVDLEALR